MTFRFASVVFVISLVTVGCNNANIPSKMTHELVVEEKTRESFNRMSSDGVEAVKVAGSGFKPDPLGYEAIRKDQKEIADLNIRIRELTTNRPFPIGVVGNYKVEKNGNLIKEIKIERKQGNIFKLTGSDTSESTMTWDENKQVFVGSMPGLVACYLEDAGLLMWSDKTIYSK